MKIWKKLLNILDDQLSGNSGRLQNDQLVGISDELDIVDQSCDLIIRFEGFRAEAYRCSAGVWTIGYGTTHNVNPSSTITKAQAYDKLENTIEEIQSQLFNMVKVPLSPNQVIALTSFIYNLGTGAFQRSTLRMKLNRREYEKAAKEFIRWNKARINGVLRPLKGLTRRRIAEKEIFLK